MSSRATLRFSNSFLLLMVAGVSLIFFEMTRGFVITLMLAAIFSAMLHPLYIRLHRILRGRRVLACILCLLAFMVLVFLPFLAFVGIVTAEALKVSTSVAPWLEEQLTHPPEFEEFIAKYPWMADLEPYSQTILAKSGEVVSSLGNFLFERLSATTLGTISFLFHLFVMLYAMFFFVMDGEKFLRKILYLMPLDHTSEMRLTDRFVSVTRATIKGTMVIGVLQGGLAGLAFQLAGIPSPVFWGTVMVVLSIIPGIGTALVWVPAAIILFASGHHMAAILLAVWCGAIVGSVDNILRPRLVGRDTKMHDLFIFLGTLGGISMFGLVGFLIGPVIAALFVTLWDIYGEVFQSVLPEVGSLDPSEDA